MAEDIIKHIFRPGSAINPVFTPSADTQLQREAVSLGAKYTGLDKFAIFD